MILGATVIGIATSVTTYFLSLYLAKKEIIDVPGERSSHAIEKPRGGGIAFVLGISAILILAWQRETIDLRLMLAIAVPGLMIAVIGLVDDVRSLGLWPRLITQVCAAGVALMFIPLPEIQFGGYRLNHAWLLPPIYLLGTIWFVNLYNFMDGIDGIASLEAMSMLLSAGLILVVEGPDGWAPLLFALTAPVAGFVIWNFPLSRIFMGDVGSGYLGFILAMLACTTSSATSLNIWTWIILGALFITDSTYTLLHRMRSGQHWTEPHRLHGYQILSRRLHSHGLVNLILVGINMMYLLPLAWFSARLPQHAWILALAAYLPLIVVCRILGAGNASLDRGKS